MFSTAPTAEVFYDIMYIYDIRLLLLNILQTKFCILKTHICCLASSNLCSLDAYAPNPLYFLILYITK